MNMNSYQCKSVVRAEREPMWKDRIHLWLYSVKSVDGVESVGVASAIEVKPIDPDGGHQITPTFSLQTAEAQQFMDELWRCGLRPTEGTGSAGSLAATERHLADMRALVFKREAPQ